jgi:hypothetical protein
MTPFFLWFGGCQTYSLVTNGHGIAGQAGRDLGLPARLGEGSSGQASFFLLLLLSRGSHQCYDLTSVQCQLI